MLIFKKYYRESMIILLLSLVMTIVGGLIIFNKLHDSPFSSTRFQQEQSLWWSSNYFENYHQQAILLYESFPEMSHENFYQAWYDLIRNLPMSYNTNYISSSKKEIRAMADQLLDQLQHQYPHLELRFFDRLFALDPALSILLDEPQSYLFVLSTASNAQILIFAVMQPTLNGNFTCKHLWYFDEDHLPPDTFLSNIFTIYHKKIR